MSDIEITVKPAVLENDARRYWHSWSVRLDGIKKEIPTSFEPDDFSHIPGAQAVYSAVVAVATNLQTYVGQGSDVFDAFARTLLLSAKEYETADGDAEHLMTKINQDLGAL